MRASECPLKSPGSGVRQPLRAIAAAVADLRRIRRNEPAGRYRSVPMAVVNVGAVRMIVLERFVAMPVRV